MIEIVGFVAATLTTLAFVPQVMKTWNTGSATDLSLGMLTTFSVGVACWLVYGVALGALPMIVGNVVTLGLALLLIGLKLRR